MSVLTELLPQLLQLFKHTVVWEKFSVEYFHVIIVCVKIFSSSRVADENFLATN